MTEEAFIQNWQRLKDNLETGRLDDAAIASRCSEAWEAFSPYPDNRFEAAVRACINDENRRFFPTIGELRGYFDDTAPPPDTSDPEIEALMKDPERRERLRRETEEWRENEFKPAMQKLLEKTTMPKADTDGEE